MKTLKTKLKRVVVLPLLGIICALSLFGGLLTLNVFPRVNADGAAAGTEGTTTQVAEYKNIAAGKTYTAPAPWGVYTASLTDSVAEDSFNYDNKWYGVNDGGGSGYCNLVEDGWITGTEPTYGYKSDIVIDLESIQLFSKVRLHVYNQESNAYLSGAKISTSLDGKMYTELGRPTVKSWSGSAQAYWTEVVSSAAVPARYVKVTVATVKRFFLNEIEVLQKNELVAENLALGKPITGPDNALNGSTATLDSLVDGKVLTGWQYGRQGANSGGEQQFKIDLGEAKTWNSVEVHGYDKDGVLPAEWINVYHSDDGSTWSTATALTIGETGENGIYVATASFNVTSRYVQVGVGRYGAWWSISEIKVLANKYGANLESCGDVVVGKKEAVSDVNLALGKAVSGDDNPWVDTIDTLTDGLTSGGWRYGSYHPDESHYTHNFIVDLGDKKSWSGVKVHGNVDNDSGINVPDSVKVFASNDVTNWTEVGTLTVGDVENNNYWMGEGDVFNTTTSRFVRIQITKYGAFSSIDEIEVYQSKEPDPVEPDPITPYTNNVAGYATISGSSAIGTYSYLKLNDGEAYGSWPNDATEKIYYASSGSHVIFSFDKEISFNSIGVHYLYGDYGIKQITSIKVEYSTDGTAYTEWETETLQLEDKTSFVFDWTNITKTAAQAKFVKITFTSSGSFAIDEVEIYAEKSYNPTMPLDCNLALDKEYTKPTVYGGYSANLTDGVAVDDFKSDADYWYALYSQNTTATKDIDFDGNSDLPEDVWGHYGDIVIDLTSAQQISKLRIHLYNFDANNYCAYLLISTSADNVTYTEFARPAVKTYEQQSGAYWVETTGAQTVSARYVKVTVSFKSAFAFINEIEVLGAHSLAKVESVAATIDEEGCLEHYKCSVCGKLYLLNEEAYAYEETILSEITIPKLTVSLPNDSCDRVTAGATIIGPAAAKTVNSTIVKDDNAPDISTLIDGKKPMGNHYQYSASDKITDANLSWGSSEVWEAAFTVTFSEVRKFSSVNVYGYVDSTIGILAPNNVLVKVPSGSEWIEVGSLTITTSGSNWTAIGSFDAQTSSQVRVVLVRNGYTSISEIEVLGEHLIKKVAKVEPTVLTTGEDEHYECACGKKYKIDYTNAQQPKYEEVANNYFVLDRSTGFYGASMTVNNNFDVNFQAHVSGTPSSVQVKCTLNGVETVIDGTALGGGEYSFTFKKLGPQNLGKAVTACLVVDGEEIETKDFTATTYLKQVFDQGDDEQQRLVADIFEYGAAAQAFVNDTSTKINTIYPEVAAKASTFVAPATTKKSATAHATVAGFTFINAGLRISSEMKIVFKFNAGANFKLTVNGVNVTSGVTQSGGVYEYCTNGISVISFDDEYKACLYSGDTLVQTVTYSVNSYVHSKYQSTTANLADFVKSIYNYGLSALNAQPINRNQNRVNVAKYSNATMGGASASVLTDGFIYRSSSTALDSACGYYTANTEQSIVLDLGKQISNLGAFELYAHTSLNLENSTYNGVLPSYITVYISSDNSNWQEVGVCYATTKTQSSFCYVVELPYALAGRYVKFVTAASGTSSDHYLISEAAVYVYSNDAEVTDVYSGCTRFSAVSTDVYAGTTSSSKNLISGKIANVEAPGKVEYEYDYYDYADSNTLFNSDASSLGVLTDGTTAATAGNTISGDSNLLFRTNNKYFKFYGYGYRRVSYDLGSICEVSSATFRAFHNPDAMSSAPTSISVYLSMDGETWYNAGEITDSSTKVKAIHANSLKNINRLARFVAFEFSVGNYVAIDELQVEGKTLANASASSYARIDSNNTANVVDLAGKGYPSTEGFAKNIYLAYHQPKNNVEVSQSELEKAVAYHNQEGAMTGDAMFDGILFLVNGDLDENTSYTAGAAMPMTSTSLKSLTASLFKDDKNVKALNAAVAKLKARETCKVADDYKVKVYFSLYYPSDVPSGKSFGTYTYNGTSVTGISSTAQKAQLLKLWIQEVEDTFAAADLTNLEIGGYYWYAESLDSDQKTVISEIKTYLNGLTDTRKLAWIPFFQAGGATEWDTIGFDIASWQPNYSFDLDVQIGRLEATAEMAKKYGTAVELEMTYAAVADVRYRARYFEYLTRAEEFGYDDTVHFYYLGGTVLNACLSDGTGAGRDIYDVTFDFIQDGKISKPAQQSTISATVQKGESTDITIVSNAKGTTTIALREPPKHGSITVNADGTVTYHAEANYTGIVSFTYSYAHAGVYSDECTVLLNVVGGNN